MSQDKKKKKQANLNQSVTSLVSLDRSREDENSEVLDHIDESIPKSVLSLKSLTSNVNSSTKTKDKEDQLKDKRIYGSINKKLKKRQKQIDDELKNQTKDEFRLKKEIIKKIGDTSLKTDLVSSKRNEPKQDKPKDQFIKPQIRLAKNLTFDPKMLASNRSSEPPPILNSVEDYSLLTPSECNIYFGREKDLVETTVSKKQHDQFRDRMSIYHNLPLQKPKLSASAYADSSDQDSSNELENFVFFAEPLDETDADDKLDRKKDSGYDEMKMENNDQTTTSKEITARYENLIMDNEIFEKALVGSSGYKESTKIIAPKTIVEKIEPLQPINQLTPLPDNQTEPIVSSTPTECSTSLKDQSDAVVLYTYKPKAKKEKKKKRKKRKTDLTRIGFVGAGKMSEAIVHYLVHSLKFNPNQIYVSSPSGRNLEHFKDKGCQITKRNIDIFTRFFCHIIFLAFNGGVVKYCYRLGGKCPFPLTTVFLPVVRHRYYIFSLVTGISLNEIKNVIFNPECNDYQFEMHRIVLAISCLYGESSFCGIDCEINKLSPIVKSFLEKFGELEHIPTAEMDAACVCLGSSAQAIAYYCLNSISDGSVKIGLSKDRSIRLIAQIAYSSVECFNRRKQDVEAIRNLSGQFFSEGHPALVGLEHLKKLNVSFGVESAMKAAYNRIKELSSIEIAPAFNSD